VLCDRFSIIHTPAIETSMVRGTAMSSTAIALLPTVAGAAALATNFHGAKGKVGAFTTWKRS
jgi:hypothetical protein